MPLLLDILTTRFPTAKKQTLKRMVETGRVTINGKVARKLKQELSDTDDVQVKDKSPAEPTPAPRVLPFPVVYEDADLLVINKPAGLLTSTVPREPRPTVIGILRDYFADDARIKIGVIHRLDRDASGLLVFSKNTPAFESLKRQFFKHTVRRVYTAVVKGTPRPAAGKIESHLIERADGTVRSTHQPGEGQHSITYYKTLKSNGTYSLLEVTLETGRKHQIRVHLSEHRTPIVGDKMYNNDASPDEPLMLMATDLTLAQPTTDEPIRCTLPVPEAFMKRLST